MMADKIKIKKTGVSLANGQMCIPATSPLHPRNIRVAKRLKKAEVAHGMIRQTRGKLHLWAHGQAVNDEIASKLSQGGKTVPVHDGMVVSKTQSERGTDKGSDSGSEHLQEAARLGRPIGGW